MNRLKFIRESGYYPYCIVDGIQYSIQEHGGTSYYDRDYDAHRPRFALVSKPVNNPLRTWGFSSKDDAFRFMAGICPGYRHIFSIGNRRLYRNDDWEVIFTTYNKEHWLPELKDRIRQGQIRHSRMYTGGGDRYSYSTECYYELSRRQALQIIKEGLFDKREAMDYAINYLAQLKADSKHEQQLMLFEELN